MTTLIGGNANSMGIFLDSTIHDLIDCPVAHAEGKVVVSDPSVVTRLRDAGQIVVTYNIKPDIYWHDGEQLTAEDVREFHRGRYRAPRVVVSRAAVRDAYLGED